MAEAVRAMGTKLMAKTPLEMFVKGIVAGCLIAARIWLLPADARRQCRGWDAALCRLELRPCARGDRRALAERPHCGCYKQP
jgi:hypothetical protein